MDEIVVTVAVFLCIFTPIVGLTIRFALKPLVESIARLMEMRASAPGSLGPGGLAERRIALLETELSQVRQELQRVAEQKDFMEQLGAGH
ncbi:MAG TPA: hypothetical protein VFZ24_01850 [Longimicrobiales bacterium]